MSISVNGQSCVPPGFRFHPTEEELLNYYLKKKVSSEKIDLDVIRDVDLNKLEPWDIQEKCRIGSTPQNDWYFFSHKDKKYPTGTRTNRATAAGFWKATGRDKVIYSSVKRIGMRKTLVFYKGRAPHGQKSDWIMHEYRLDDHCDLAIISQSNSSSLSSMGEGATQEDGWVVCRVFKKKNHHKSSTSDSPKNSSSVTSDAKTQLLHAGTGDDALDQILQYMGRSCKRESQAATTTTSCSSRPMVDPVFTCGLQEMFMKLPGLHSPTMPSLADNQTSYGSPPPAIGHLADCNAYHADDWAAFDRLLASQLNGPSTDGPKPSPPPPQQQQCCSAVVDDVAACLAFYPAANYQHGGDDGDLWSLTRTTSSSMSDRISHVSL
ncbi:hypothetical protein Cni_G03909 [Canna indica]|uniref:NAC domain-containing protein n=1 Tax=Canna indica TaxID=4628 RepID=A0AAQ3JSH8_9LILI|nr:hypothetical protein Cni_G03909 [Canna indica]